MRRTGRAAIAAAFALALAAASQGAASAAPLADVDAMLMGGNLTGFTLLGIGPSTAQYSLSGNCSLFVGGSSVPTFVDVPPDEGGTGGTCGGISGTGTFNSLGCGSGTAVGSMSIVEPLGDSVGLSYTIAFVAGVGVLSGTWTDDGGSGPAAGVVLIVPRSPVDCTGVITQYNFTAMVSAEY
jgi:hypothetical protein